MTPVFADHNSTTPIDERVLDTMMRVSRDIFGNPSSGHAFGAEAASIVWEAREHVAELVDCRPGEVFFTSGATESNNWMLAQDQRLLGRGLITTRLEHPSVLSPAAALAEGGAKVVYWDVEHDGRITLPSESPLLPSFEGRGGLISVIAAHNEFHFSTDLPSLSAWGRKHGLLLHSDATQAVGRLPISFQRFGLCAMSMSAHKLYGPKGIGALIVDEEIQPLLRPLLLGGGQQDGLRSGTLAAPLIAGFGEACRLARWRMNEDAQHLHRLAELLLRSMTERKILFRLVGPQQLSDRLPGCLALVLPEIETSHFCDQAPELAISSASACKSQHGDINGLDSGEGRHFVRIGLGRHSSEEDIVRIAQSIAVFGRRQHVD